MQSSALSRGDCGHTCEVRSAKSVVRDGHSGRLISRTLRGKGGLVCVPREMGTVSRVGGTDKLRRVWMNVGRIIKGLPITASKLKQNQTTLKLLQAHLHIIEHVGKYSFSCWPLKNQYFARQREKKCCHYHTPSSCKVYSNSQKNSKLNLNFSLQKYLSTAVTPRIFEITGWNFAHVQCSLTYISVYLFTIIDLSLVTISRSPHAKSRKVPLQAGNPYSNFGQQRSVNHRSHRNKVYTFIVEQPQQSVMPLIRAL